jgi:hypothetical protein
MASSSRRSGPGVEQGEKTRMAVIDIGPRLRARLGTEPCTELEHALNAAHAGTLNAATERFEARLTATCADLKSDLRENIVTGDTALRVAVTEGLASIRDEMNRLRADVLRWSLLFWLGQFAALATMFSVLLRALGR